MDGAMVQPDGECTEGIHNCFASPCLGVTCAADPSAECKENYCGGCNYYFVNTAGEAVDCELNIEL